MRPEADTLPFSAKATVPAHWLQALVRLGLVWFALILAFRSDWAAMFDQWWNSSTYNHILLVPVIIAWLLWQRRETALGLPPKPSPWGLVATALAAFVWVLGAFSGFDLLRQAGVVGLLPATALLLLGPRVFAAVLFPMVYFAFLVPFGDELVPPLQMITAKITIALVRLTEVPAVIDGVFIDTPAGLFEVAEACSGVKFLIAMVALGVLVANQCFISWRRRGLFLALCIIAPILANGVRAWATVFAAQYVGAERAAGFDHIVYGWIFFALVIAAILALSWRYFDRAVDDPLVDATKLAQSRVLDGLERARIPLAGAVTGGALILAAADGWAQAADRLAAPLPQQIFLPAVPGWQRVDFEPEFAWEPRALGADHRLIGSYADARGRKVDVFVALYASQKNGKEAGGYGQGALIPGGDWSWEGAGAPVAGARSERLRAMGRIERLALTWYRNGSLVTGSNTRLKLATIQDRLVLRANPTMILILSAENGADNDAQAALDAFRQSTGPVARWMDLIAPNR